MSDWLGGLLFFLSGHFCGSWRVLAGQVLWQLGRNESNNSGLIGKLWRWTTGQPRRNSGKPSRTSGGRGHTYIGDGELLTVSWLETLSGRGRYKSWGHRGWFIHHSGWRHCSLHGKVYFRVLERRIWLVVKHWISSIPSTGVWGIEVLREDGVVGPLLRAVRLEFGPN